MMASMIAGTGFPNSGLGAVHGLSLPLGGRFNIPAFSSNRYSRKKFELPHESEESIGGRRNRDLYAPG
jgi:hypothetical protein